VVQLGGLEPPTSCSTDRRSNQLSYNCILGIGTPKKGVRTGRKLGATGRFGKADQGVKFSVVPAKTTEATPGFAVRLPIKQKPGPLGPGCVDAKRKTPSGGRLVVFRRGGLDRFDGFGRDLLAQLGELLGLGRERLELFARLRGPQLQRLRR
jgi:hypothetical protein